MTLQIRDDRARELVQTLARKRKVTMTEAVIQALESELRRESEKEPLASRVARIAADLAAQAKPGGRTMDKEEIDAMWGHSWCSSIPRRSSLFSRARPMRIISRTGSWKQRAA